MKHLFLLDENILYHAIRGVDRQNRPDSTATELIALIGCNCHKIALHPTLIARYHHHLQQLLGTRSRAIEPVSFINNFLKNAAKHQIEYCEAPELPQGFVIPTEDIPIVRVALISHALIVTADEKLRQAIAAQPTLGLRALSPAEAVQLAQEI